MKAELKAELRDLSIDYKSGKQILTFEVQSDFRPYFDEFKGKPLTVLLKPFRKKRSLDANAFFWATIGDIAEVTGISTTEIYRSYIREIGGNCEVFTIETDHIDKWSECWGSRGIGWITEVIGQSATDGFTSIISYYGSSTYDSKQMKQLIDLALQDAREQGIPPRLTARERAAAIEMWGEA